MRDLAPRPKREFNQASAEYQEAAAEDLRTSKKRKGLVPEDTARDNEDDVFSSKRKLSPTGERWAGPSKKTLTSMCAFLAMNRITNAFFAMAGTPPPVSHRSSTIYHR